ncbi:MAG: S-layer homology domain-containing protein [Dehalococcoidia bacterium]|nr:S-layer homology domain-containing protein [Dehalococcoidia bacterium]
MSRFTDVPANHWAAEVIDRAALYGVAAGYEDGTFRGDQTVSRYEAVVFATRVMDRALLASGFLLGLGVIGYMAVKR